MNTKELSLPYILIITLLLLLASHSNSYNQNHTPTNPKQIPAVYVFGDSLVDSGNNNYLPIESYSKFPPYGIDFGGKPTGRYTNGKTVVDYLSIHLGLPFIPPYLSLTKMQRNKIKTGINFASAGSGILSETNNNHSLTLDKQIKLFEKVIKNNLPNLFDDKEKLERHLSESLFVVSTGLNDHFTATGNFQGSRKFDSCLLKEFSLRIQKIYSLGVRRFFVNNIAPAGCFPSMAAKSRPRGECNEKINRAISFYNNHLPNVLQKLQSQLPNFTFIHANLYEHLIELRTTGYKYGISEIWKPCCPNSISGDLKCYPYNATCPNRNTHIFFDVHPSQITNHIYARHCFIEKRICKGFKMLY
ncbi:GDSL esterase/lipase At2g03980-like [Trifolium pratense]|uniref:GDSL esterase/lipase At2g03980-like n=1 Tax=Trifolium pratense TaxID=57577 RepID=UPI001E693FB5|nr:GDSL esterase/lipase At2g03980-like [Trifolium pratense]